MNNRLISILLLCALTVTATACGDASEKTDGTTSSESSESSATQPETTAYSLPSKADYNGTVFNILAADGRAEIYDAEQTGDVLDDAAFRRESDVEEYLNIDINYIHKESGSQVEGEYVKFITNSVLAGDAEYDLTNVPIVFACKILSDGYFMNVSDLKLDLSNPWWVSGITDKLKINDKLYLLAGDFSVSLISALHVCYFNQKLAEDLKLESPYEVVKSGNWTVNKLLTMIKDSSLDLNGDSEITLENDRLSFISHPTPFNSIQMACNVNIFDCTDGQLSYNGLSERYSKLYDTLKSAFDTKDITFTNTTYENDAKIFADDRALFMFTALRITSELRNMRSDYGILPLPKLEESDEYRIDVPVSSVQWMIPINTSNPELTAAFCEYYSYRSYVDVIPAYYEVTLKDKYSRDTNTQDMLDIIQRSRILSIDSTLGYRFNPGPNLFSNVVSNGIEPASYFASNESTWKTQLEATMATFE